MWRRRDFITGSSLIGDFSLFSPSEDFVFNFYTLGAYNKGARGKGGSFLCHRVEAYYDGDLSGAGSNNMVTNVSCF